MQNSFSACCILMDMGAVAYVETWICGTNLFSADFEVITLGTYWFHFVIIINVNLNCNF